MLRKQVLSITLIVVMVMGIMPLISTTVSAREITYKDVCAGGHTLAVDSNGTLWAWGQNTSGQLGIGTGGNM